MGFDTAKEFIGEGAFAEGAGRKCHYLVERSRLDVHGMAQALGVSEGKAA